MSRLHDPKVLVIDVESTCWELPDKPGRDEISEVIEIGLAVVDTDKLIIDHNEGILIRPQRSRVSPFCTKLTTLTQQQVDTGITFQEAMKKLQNEFHSGDRTFISWGDY